MFANSEFMMKLANNDTIINTVEGVYPGAEKAFGKSEKLEVYDSCISICDVDCSFASRIHVMTLKQF